MNARPSTLFLGERQAKQRTPYPKSLYVAALFFFLLALPVFQGLLGYRLFRYLVPIWLLWALIFSLESKGAWRILLSSRRFELFFFALWCLVLIIYPLVNPQIINVYEESGNFLKITSAMVPMIMSYVMGMAYRARGETRVFTILAVLLLAGLSINCTMAMPMLFGGGLEIREQLANYQDMSKAEIGFGGLGFYAGMVLLVPFFLNVILGAKGFARLILLALLIPIIINLYLTSLLIILTTLGLSFCLYILMALGKKRFKRRALAVILIGIIFLFIGGKLSSEKPLQYQIDKIDALLNPTFGKVPGDTSKKRLFLYKRSIKTFLAFPFFGAGADPNSEELYYNFIGGHSGVMDALAIYGMLFIIYLIFLAIKFRHLRALHREEDQSSWYAAGLVSMCTYFLLILLDPLLLCAFTGWAFFFFALGPAQPLTYPRRLASRMLRQSGTIGPVSA